MYQIKVGIELAIEEVVDWSDKPDSHDLVENSEECWSGDSQLVSSVLTSSGYEKDPQEMSYADKVATTDALNHPDGLDWNKISKKCSCLHSADGVKPSNSWSKERNVFLEKLI
jgi:hypothetical protein